MQINVGVKMSDFKGCKKTISMGLDYEYCGMKDIKNNRILLCKNCYEFEEDWEAKWINVGVEDENNI